MTDHDLPKGLARSAIAGLGPPRRGKVRDVYDVGDDHLLLVATDRISAYDHVLDPPIPGKGRILHQLSAHWFGKLEDLVPHHLLASHLRDLPIDLRNRLSASAMERLHGRTALVRKARVVPFECVARGYLAGSAFREYEASGTTCGVPLPPGLRRADRLPEPIFTPATKAEEGHDENVSFDRMADELGHDLASRLRDLTLALYRRGAAVAASRDLVLADTKFEFGIVPGEDGVPGGELLLIDEVLTPDSSRYWDVASWRPGTEPPSFDKQFVRNWLDASGWDHASPPPRLPDDVVAGTLERYTEAFRRLTGQEPELS